MELGMDSCKVPLKKEEIEKVTASLVCFKTSKLNQQSDKDLLRTCTDCISIFIHSLLVSNSDGMAKDEWTVSAEPH